jgi:hypothetical protein
MSNSSIINPDLLALFQLVEHGNLKEDAAQTLSNLAQATFPPQQQTHAGGPQGNPFPPLSVRT